MSFEKSGVIVFGAAAVVGGAMVISGLLTPPPQATATAGEFDVKAWGALAAVVDDDSPAWPAEFRLPEGLIGSTAVLLSEDATASYWSLGNADGKLCLGVTFPGPNQIAIFNCADEAEFTSHGLAVQAHTADGSVRAHFLPDTVDARSATDGYTALTDNLVITSPFNATGQEITLEAKTSDTSRTAPFTLRPFEEPEDFTAPRAAESEVSR